MLYTFQTVFPSLIRRSKLHTQLQVLVWQILDAVCAVWAPDKGRKARLKHVEHLTEINKLRNVASFWLYSANILATHGLMSVKIINKLRGCSDKMCTEKWKRMHNSRRRNKKLIIIFLLNSIDQDFRKIRVRQKKELK